jgi:hypothetical protein
MRFVAIALERRASAADAIPTRRPRLGNETAASPERAPRRSLAELLDDLRETWAQTTFYLFDPDSWR